GRVAVGGFDALYRVVVFDADGRPERQICRRDAEPVPFTAAERGEDYPPELARLADAIAASDPPPSPPAVGALILGASGRLWVQRDRAAPFDDALYGVVPGARWDVFDTNGRYLGEVRAPDGARPMAASGDTVFGFEIGEYDETWVVAYRIETG
ncbi:MAG: hypothetical protein ACODAE_10135, partial [Gemmatimonadota bacterium]